MDPVKVEGIMDWPVPTKLKEAQAFMGFCNYYRRFIKDYSRIARPLFDLTKKDHEWNWTKECQDSFDQLKKLFTERPLLAMPDTTKQFRVECDASDYATGAVLSQKEEDDLYHPVAYLSKSMAPAE